MSAVSLPFDDPREFNDFKIGASSVDSLNFVIDFQPDHAYFARDLTLEQMQEALETKVSNQPPSRWIHIWKPEEQKEIIKALGKKYDFSLRLTGLMCCDPLIDPKKSTRHTPSSTNNLFGWDVSEKPSKTAAKVQLDLEGRPETANSSPEKLNLNHYRIVDEVWHYSSVDWGSQYLCIGYNSLYNTDSASSIEGSKKRQKSNNPAGKRVWTWLTLCSDGTVISITENPYPGTVPKPFSPMDQKDLDVVRRNLDNVLVELYQAYSKDGKSQETSIMTLHLHEKLTFDNEDGTTSSTMIISSSLLFYYLFDDWYTSYSLVARREHQYGARLERLREEMFKKASLDHMEEVHHIGRQLSVLKRIYQSYDIIIGDIMKGPQPVTKTKNPPSRSATAFEHLVQETTAKAAGRSEVPQMTAYGVHLSAAASVRFERLKSRISLYALSEINDCIAEKESLAMMNFNLITMKQSTAVERLTRITILLAKATIPFLFLSLMTAYFSVPFVPSPYTITTYWVTFAVILSFSVLGLVMFGRLSGTQEGRTIYRSLTEAVTDKIRGRKNEDDETLVE